MSVLSEQQFSAAHRSTDVPLYGPVSDPATSYVGSRRTGQVRDWTGFQNGAQPRARPARADMTPAKTKRAAEKGFGGPSALGSRW